MSKTESVKALGVHLGRFVLVFCCDETFSFQAMDRIFVGLCQIQSILQGLKAASVYPNAEIKLVGKTLKINPHAGIFITMHPGYAGQSNLPNNLKKRFRSMVMTRPDGELITQVMLFSQGFRTAEILASKVVPFFSLCDENYLNNLIMILDYELSRPEQEILVQSVSKTIVSKLVADNVPLLTSLLADIFPGIEYSPSDLNKLEGHIRAVATQRHLVVGGIQNIQHGLMMGGPLATNDGLLTHILRRIIDNLRGEDAKRHWIIFDGDTDPEWVKNLNSVLDDNKLLTLPNGERLDLLNNHATQATVSCCGKVCFGEDTENYLKTTPDVALE
ncbi:hypothetical protein PSHT_12170, partial [Puccinia striiformis]